MCRALLENREKEKVSDEQKSKEKKIERKKTVGKFRKSSLLEREPVRKKRENPLLFHLIDLSTTQHTSISRLFFI